MEIPNISGSTFHLPGDDMDTDRIIKLINRYKRYNKGCSILVADVNFGCGPSSECAIIEIQHCGIKAIIARSFAAIFRRNATANGLVCVTVDADDHHCVKRADVFEVHINLEKMEIQTMHHAEGFPGKSILSCLMPS